MSAEFSTAARAAIYEAGGGRCVGCGAANITAQHRRRRGMGGTRDPFASSPANGVPLCGHGTAGCHGWTEHHPGPANLLGWALTVGERQLEAPFYTRFGWRRWVVEETPGRPAFYAVAFVYDEDLDRLELRERAVEAWQDRADAWR